MSEVSKPHIAPPNAAFWTRAKPCEEALADLIESYNGLADRIEEAWADNQRLEEQLRVVEQERDEWKRVAENLARDPEGEDA